MRDKISLGSIRKLVIDDAMNVAGKSNFDIFVSNDPLLNRGTTCRPFRIIRIGLSEGFSLVSAFVGSARLQLDDLRAKVCHLGLDVAFRIRNDTDETRCAKVDILVEEVDR